MTDEKTLIKEQAELIRQSNEMLEAQNKRLKELNREKDQVIGIVSHDLKSPLNRVFALTNLIKMTGENLTEDQLEYIDKIQIVVREGLSLIRNMLDIRAIEEQKIELNKTEIDIRDLLSDLIKEYEWIAIKKDVTLELKFSMSEEVILSDRQYLKRIFENILTNAIKYTRLGSKVVINLYDEEKPGYFTGSIQDYGYGIKKKEMHKLFQKYTILSSQATGGESSNGLGLSIVKSLVEKLEGKVWCETTDGKGSTFFVTLPRR